MIADGRLKIGEPCTPYTMIRFKTLPGGRLFEQAITIGGRKFSLLEIRAEMVVQHQQYMHLYSDDQITAMPAGIAMNDELHFFKGDTPAQQFERGTQEGGVYKCGGCGCHALMMEDIAHALECKWHSLINLQELVLAGKHGNQPGALQTV